MPFMPKIQRKGKKNVGRVNKTAAKAITAIVQKELHKASEDKYATAYNATTYPIAQQYTAGILTAADFKPVLPPVYQGVKMNQRVGNKLTPKALVIKFTMVMTGAPTTNSSDVLWGRLFVVSHKSLRDHSSFSALANPSTLLLLDGENEVAYKGIPGDNNIRVNRRQWTVHADKLMKFQRGFGTLPQAANVVPWIGDQIYTSPLCTHQVSVRVPLPKELLYKDFNEQFPTNAYPTFAFGYNSPGESTVPTNGEMDYRIAVSYTSHFDFEDE